MSEMVERVAKALFMRGKPRPGDAEYTGQLWPNRCDEGSGPPFDADGWRDMARVAITAMHEPTEGMLNAGPPEPYMDRDVWAKMIDAALEGQ